MAKHWWRVVSLAGLIFAIGAPAAAVQLDGFLESAQFAPREHAISASSSELVRRLRPILSDRIGALNYDRLHVILQFLDFYDEIVVVCPELSPLEVASQFEPNLDAKLVRGGPCVALTLDLLENLPAEWMAYPAAGILPPRFDQFGFPVYCHACILIRFANPSDEKDRGVVMLDPSFDFCEPIVLRLDGTPVRMDAGLKGVWEYAYIENQIVCRSQAADGEEEWDENDRRRFTMTFRTDEWTNLVRSSALPMVLADRRYSLLSRYPDGTHIAHMNVEIDRERVIWDTEEGRLPPLPFSLFSAGDPIDSSFEEKLFLLPGQANAWVRTVIAHLPVLDQLYLEYLQALEQGDGCGIVKSGFWEARTSDETDRLATVRNRLQEG